MRSTPDLAFWVRVLAASARPESDSRLRVFINSASHAGFLNERGKKALALSGTLIAFADEDDGFRQ